MKSSFTQKEILHYLEETDQETYHLFIDLEPPHIFTAGSRLTLYADENRWALAFEISGYVPSGYRAEIELLYFGNCLINLQSEGNPSGYTSNMKSVLLIDSNEVERIADDMSELLSKKANKIRVRDTMLDIEQEKSVYLAKGISDKAYDNPENLIDIPSLIRYLDEQHPILFRASDKELRMCLPADLPTLMKIDEWHHKPYVKFRHMTSPTEYHYQTIGTPPSDNDTYRMIAEILVSRDPKKWNPTLEANNNWRNWKNAGYM